MKQGLSTKDRQLAAGDAVASSCAVIVAQTARTADVRRGAPADLAASNVAAFARKANTVQIVPPVAVETDCRRGAAEAALKTVDA